MAEQLHRKQSNIFLSLRYLSIYTILPPYAFPFYSFRFYVRYGTRAVLFFFPLPPSASASVFFSFSISKPGTGNVHESPSAWDFTMYSASSGHALHPFRQSKQEKARFCPGTEKIKKKKLERWYQIHSSK